MFKRCSNCENRIYDLKALLLCVYICKCVKKEHLIVRPFWSGWKCKDWRKEDGK